MEYPIIFRNPVIGLLSEETFVNGKLAIRRKNLVWVTEELTSFSTVSSGNNSFKCSHSNLFTNYKCIQVRLISYSLKSKPWMCNLNVHLFKDPETEFESLPASILRRRTFPLPISVYPITILVEFGNKWESATYTNLLRMRNQNTLRQHNQYLLGSSVIQHIFIEMAIGTIEKSKTSIGKLSANITEVSAVRSRKIKFIVLFEKVHLNIKTQEESSIKIITEKAYFSNNDEIFWGNAVYTGKTSYSDLGVFRHMSMCENEFRRTSSHFMKPHSDDEERMFHAFAYVLQSIMGNYTYLLSEYTEKKCVNGKIMSDTDSLIRYSALSGIDIGWLLRGTPISSYNTGISINISLSGLRIITCGERGVSEFAFRELLKAYDSLSWALILISGLTLGFAFNFLWSPVVRSRHLLSVIKVLLEQGDPFLASMARISRLRWVISAYLLVGIVLSNAYKNTNVYNMILPRQVLLYEFLHQLSQDNISIYSRTISFNDRRIWETGKQELWKYRYPYNYFSYNFMKHGISINGLDGVQIFSEIRDRFSYAKNFASLVHKKRSFWIYGHDDVNLTKLQLSLVRQSELHLKVPYLVGTFVEILSPLYLMNYRDAVDHFSSFETRYNGYFQKWFFEMEERIFKEDLLKCNRTAIVVPQYKAKSYARHVLTKKPSMPISISKESYSPFYIHANLKGYIPPFILRNLRGIQNAALLEWWAKNIGDSDRNPVAQQKTLEAPTMAGSILVVFTLLLSGLVLGMLVFLLESRYDILNVIVKILKKIRAAILFIYNNYRRILILFKLLSIIEV